VRRALVHFVLGFLVSGSLFAYSQTEHPANTEISSYLMRIQRTTPRSAICVLLRRDGQFHLETTHDDRIKVIEGSLPGSELLKVQQMLDSDGLLRLSSEKLSSPRTTRPFEVLQISIFRTDHWQNLIFTTDKDSQTEIRRSLNPLLKWMESLPKQSHQLMNEDESNNCQSPKKIELKNRP
jgi:hypothetical protein